MIEQMLVTYLMRTRPLAQHFVLKQKSLNDLFVNQFAVSGLLKTLFILHKLYGDNFLRF